MALAPRSVRPTWPLHPLLYVPLLLVLLVLPSRPSPPPAPAPPAPPSREALAEELGHLPLVFEPAAVGAAPEVRFQARALGGTLLFDEAGLRLAHPRAATLRLSFLDAAPATLALTDPLPGRVSRFVGSDPAAWQRDLPTAAGLVYRQLYPGIELRYDGAAGRLKGTYQLAPGADPARIRWRYEGAQSIQIDPAGDLRLDLALRQPGAASLALAERAPVAWQEVGGARVPVEAAYALAADGGVGFRLGRYDPRLPLTIDPTLEFSTYLGSSALDTFSDIALDAQGNIYAIGKSQADDFPLKDPLQQQGFGGGASDAVLLKLSPGGTALLFSTYLGGEGEDEGMRVLLDQHGLARNSQGARVLLSQPEIVVLGNTHSPNFPTTLHNPTLGDQDMFVARVDADGQNLVWSRLLGGSSRDDARDAALDAEGQVTLVGMTQSDDFTPGSGPVYLPTQPGPNSGVVAQLTADGATLTFRSYLGLTGGVIATAVALAPDGGIVVGGQTQGDFPIKQPLPGMGEYQGGVNDGFVAKLTPGATDLVFSTYLGGDGNDEVRDLALDSEGTIYLTGTTTSSNFPQTDPKQNVGGQDGFVGKISADGQTLPFSVLQGGSEMDELTRIGLDSLGNIYLLGDSQSTDIPLVNQLQPVPPQNGKPNLLLIKLSNDGQTTQIRTLLGGSDYDGGDDVHIALAVSPVGRVVLGGSTLSSDLPLRNPLRSHLAGDADSMLMVIDTAPQLGLTAASPASLPACSTDPCPAVSVTWTLTVPYPLSTTLAITLPTGLELVDGSLSGTSAVGKPLRFSGEVLPNIPRRISYQVRARQGLMPGSLLNTTASASSAGAPALLRSQTLALPGEPADALVMIYASSDNNLLDDTLRLAEQAEHNAGAHGVISLLLLDGPGPDDAYLYRLQPLASGQTGCVMHLHKPDCDGRYVLNQTYWKWSDNLASPDTLTDFVASAQRAYPATRRVLSLVGHGGGWSPTLLAGQPSRHGGQPTGELGGMLWDDHPGTSLSTPALAQALRAALPPDQPLDLLYLDACAMGQIEVAYELRGTANYLLASPNWKWAAFPYDRHLQSAGASDGRALGLAWLVNEQAALAAYPDEPYTYTLFDMSKVGALREAVHGLAVHLMTLQREQVQAGLRSAERYDSDQNGVLDEHDSAVDLGSLATKAATSFPEHTGVVSAAQQLSQTLQSAVVASSLHTGQPWLFPNSTWHWNSSDGLAIFLPLPADDWRRRYYRTMAFAQESRWADLIDWLWGTIPPPDGPVCPSPCDTPPGQPQRHPVYLPLIHAR